jgi:hypothetical protein
MFQSPPTRHAKNQPDTSADQRHAELTQLGPSWSTKMSTFNHPEKPEKFDQPKKTHTWFPPDKIAVCGCVWLFWGGKEKQLFLTQTSAKNRLNPSKLLRSWRRTIVLRWFSHALGDDSRRGPRCFCTWAACRTTGGLERSWDSWGERGVTGGH